MTIKDALDAVSKNHYVLPAIQREFVWKPEQISRLFDSLMQGYPFGTFLFWKVEPEKSAEFKFFGFVQNFHERDAAHCPELGTLPNRELTAVLDGQQRLTALNIGLRGSVSIKEPNKWRSNPNAFPKKILHLDLMASRGEDDEGEAYRFRFLETQKAAADDGALWYPVPDILMVPNTAKLSQWLYGKLTARGITADSDVFNRASDTLHQLYQVVQVAPTLTFYTERSQELDRVLRIFIRMNSGGTVLSYSDLLLSIAVAQWSKLDARQEIHGLVDEINNIGAGFNLSKDFVLKAGLMLADIASVGFKVENFNRANMITLENVWSDVRRATILTVELAASFGLAEQTLRADSALLPIAYYIFKRKPPENWLGHPSHAAERESIRSWLIRSLLKSSGIWGSGLDTLLTALRDVIRIDHQIFPSEALEKVMAGRGKSLSFGPEEVEDLLDMEYGDRRLFPALSILFPFIDVRQLHHIDHFFPKSQLQRRKLERAGCDAVYVEESLAARDRLANLQLLEGLLNVSKNDSLPGPWLEATYQDPAIRGAVLDRHDLGFAPATHQEFLAFYNARRERLRARFEPILARAS
ncbi:MULTISPECIES: DUF262 domain-containing protein [Variovorax]|uniref:DUF262 domain-containing protein n=1 Tax=Variovorax TaxID=34072 RepID=UPI001DE9D50E|nr:DUF262 domain-containing protein [Variovorax paradoxus]MBW8719697.1 DUF262 domain-containing protein [Variovorax paradoxus]